MRSSASPPRRRSRAGRPARASPLAPPVGRASRVRALALLACLAVASPRLASAAAKHPVAAAASPSWDINEPGLGTWETCDTCERCVLDALPGGVDPPSPAPDAKGRVHCAKCLGCSVILSRMTPSQPMLGKDVKVFTGASGAAVMKGVTSAKGDVFVKAWCGVGGGYRQTPQNHPLPATCEKDGEHLPEGDRQACPDRGGHFGWSECNFRFLNALDKLAEDANLTAATPRTWTERVRSFLPMNDGGDGSRGVKVDAKFQFYDVAEGVSVEAFYGDGVTERVLNLTRSIPHEDVVRAAVFDLLFSEQDRHGQNVFVSESGRLHVLDNEGSFGPINSMLIPGGQKFEVYRIGYGAVCCGNLPGGAEKNCPGKLAEHSAPEVWLDYRCHARGRFVGTALPPGVEPFLRRIANMDEAEVMKHYGMSHPSHAEVLKRRVDDLLDGGFERAMIAAYKRQRVGNGVDYGNDFFYGLQPPCCAAWDRKAGCAIRVNQQSAAIVADMREEDREVWPGNDAGREARALWPGPTEAPHLKRDKAPPGGRTARGDLGGEEVEGGGKGAKGASASGGRRALAEARGGA